MPLILSPFKPESSHPWRRRLVQVRVLYRTRSRCDRQSSEPPRLKRAPRGGVKTLPPRRCGEQLKTRKTQTRLQTGFLHRRAESSPGFFAVKMTASSLLFLVAAACLTPACSSEEVIGGREVTPHSRPFMASLQYHGEHVCGGVLIHPQWVLTAAHCHHRFARGQSSHVVLGAHSLSKDETSKQTFGVTKLIPFSGFTSDPESHDIMLVKGDSGGPLVCGGAFSGLVSGGLKCGDAKKPGVYTLLTRKVQAWIQRKLPRPPAE
ncbi:Granzyme K [Myotis brandtii]|uniref:Granzyme K n=1 Tax=Myotis brandtii TaxID=109478 RepID=S7PVS3_MYOBR|nr:Granzyme K [Myotis brandtii]